MQDERLLIRRRAFLAGAVAAPLVFPRTGAAGPLVEVVIPLVGVVTTLTGKVLSLVGDLYDKPALYKAGQLLTEVPSWASDVYKAAKEAVQTKARAIGAKIERDPQAKNIRTPIVAAHSEDVATTSTSKFDRSLLMQVDELDWAYVAGPNDTAYVVAPAWLPFLVNENRCGWLPVSDSTVNDARCSSPGCKVMGYKMKVQARGGGARGAFIKDASWDALSEDEKKAHESHMVPLPDCSAPTGYVRPEACE
jgi:hypothetical protein